MVKLSWVNIFRKDKNVYVYRNKLAKKDKYKLYGLFIRDVFSIGFKYHGRINLRKIIVTKDWFGYKIIFQVERMECK